MGIYGFLISFAVKNSRDNGQISFSKRAIVSTSLFELPKIIVLPLTVYFLETIQKHWKAVKENPAAWLPWNYFNAMFSDCLADSRRFFTLGLTSGVSGVGF